MKNIIGTLVILTSLNAVAEVSPTQFTCTGENGTAAHYTTTSFIGKPTFSVSVDGENVQYTSEIETQGSPMGALVTVRDTSKVIVDGAEQRYTLVVPLIQLDETSAPVAFNTVLIQTSVTNPFFHAPGAVVSEHNTYIALSCTAEYVVF